MARVVSRCSRSSSTPPARPATWADASDPDDNLTSYCALAVRTRWLLARADEDVPAGAVGLAACSAPGVVRHPVSAADTAVRNLRSLGRLMKPPAQSLSPIMVERRLVTVRDARRRSRSCGMPRSGCGATVNDAFLAALGNGFGRYHEKHGAPVGGLQAAVAVNIRRPGDSPYGNHVSGGSFIILANTEDPATCMTICHDAVTRLRGHRSAAGRRHGHGDEHPGAVRLRASWARSAKRCDCGQQRSGRRRPALSRRSPRCSRCTDQPLHGYRGQHHAGVLPRHRLHRFNVDRAISTSTFYDCVGQVRRGARLGL